MLNDESWLNLEAVEILNSKLLMQYFESTTDKPDS